MAVLVASLSLVAVGPATTSQAQPTDDTWSTSLHDVERTAASTDTNISPATAPTLTKLWSFQTGGPVASTPTVTGGTAYFGSWDGYEYAVNATTGALQWKTYLGLTDAPADCTPSGEIGVSSPATVSNGVVYVGGGDGYFYALNATTGAVDWRVWVEGSNTPGNYDGHYNWSGPLVVNGYAYVGVASFGDCPLIQGQLVQINITTGTIANTLNLVPNGQVGGGIWTSPAYDPATNTIFADTGTENAPTQQWAQSYLAIDANSLEVKDYWKLPASEAVEDSDFGTSTTLFSDANGDQLVASINKNGEAYAFNRNNLPAGPIWQTQIAIGGDCPTCGESSVSSGAFGAGTLFMAGNTGVIDGVGYPGTVNALNPATGAFIWQHAAPGSVIGALAYDNGMVFDGGGSYLEVLSATTGQRLYSYGTGSQIYGGPSIADGIVYIGDTNGQVIAFAEPTSPPPTPPADPNCPSGFTCQDIGSPTPAGSETVTSGNWTVSAGGTGVTGTTDSFRLMSEPTDGATQVSAHVTVAPTGTGGQAGLMIRQNNNPGSPYYAVLAEPGDALSVQYRTTFDGPTTVDTTTTDTGLPLYLMIQRVGDTLQAATSENGSSYTLVPGSNTAVAMPPVNLAGLAVSSGTNGTAATASFSALSVGTPTVTPVPLAPASPCPSGWSCQDIGNPALVGNQSLSSGTWTVEAAGNGFGQASITSYSEWPVDDQFHFVWQPVSTDTTISAQVTSQSDTSANSQAGVMLRADTTGGGAYYAAWISPGRGVTIDYRDTDGLLDNVIANLSATAPAWLEVARSGDTFTAYTSSDGTTWTPVIGSSEVLPNLEGTILAGLAVSSDDAGAVGTATFQDVDIAASAPAPPNLCPTGWACNDIGFPTPAGNQSLQGGTWTVQGGGGDITGISDSFRFIAESQETDGTVSAEVASQSDTDPYAKSGVMVRVSTSDTSAYYGVFVTPANGIQVQYRTQEAGGTASLAVSGTAPTYLEISRSGDTYTAYDSSDGANWNEIAGSTVSIPTLVGTLQAGLAVCSHDALALNTTVFEAVSITGTIGNGGLPSLWSDQDIGAPTPAGSASYGDGTFTVQGGGSDIWGGADQFNYVWQNLSSDASIVAQVTSQTDSDPWAKAGVMIKQSTTAGSPYAMVALTPANGIAFQYGFNTTVSGGNYSFPNGWVRLDRDGDVFTAYESTDGFNWDEIGQVDILMSRTATVGLFVCSHNPGALSTATFANVTVSPTGAAPVPSPWASTDVGSPAVAGTSSYANGTFTVNGSGTDI
ncbi:MAG: PQQ-binding-like beta-propeller repeat protein [Acidimicrobiales bacterium]